MSTPTAENVAIKELADGIVTRMGTIAACNALRSLISFAKEIEESSNIPVVAGAVSDSARQILEYIQTHEVIDPDLLQEAMTKSAPIFEELGKVHDSISALGTDATIDDKIIALDALVKGAIAYRRVLVDLRAANGK